MENVEIVDYRLAKDILHGRRKVSVDTSIRLERYFGVNDRYFLDLQNDIDIRNELRDKGAEFDRIKHLSRA
ncbi:transcriptional regulator [Limosilactobacillus pontis]|uniref:helix-turn-helix transcriptional regulator n=1 Tax=Limosilactobacillus pontis TaxID=35787 RepID=UPI00387E3FA7